MPEPAHVTAQQNHGRQPVGQSPSPGRKSGVLVIPLDPAPEHPFTPRELEIVRSLARYERDRLAGQRDGWVLAMDVAELNILIEKLQTEALAQ